MCSSSNNNTDSVFSITLSLDLFCFNNVYMCMFLYMYTYMCALSKEARTGSYVPGAGLAAAVRDFWVLGTEFWPLKA